MGGLDEVTTYEFRVVAFDLVGNETPSATRTVTTLDATPPNQLAPITVGARSSTTIELSWSAPADNVGVTGYRIHQGATTGGAILHSPTGTSQTITGLAPMTAYTFAIVARDAAGNWSPERTVTTSTTDTVAPTAPANLRATGSTGTSISLAWDAATDDVATTGYRLYQVVDGVDTLVSEQPGTTFTATGLTNATMYTFRVEAHDAAANTSALSSLTTTTADVLAPTAATALTPSLLTGTSVRVSWTAAIDTVGVTGYELERLVGATWTLVGARSATLHRDVTGLTSAVSYSFRVRAFDAAGNASTSAMLVVATLDDVAPSTPTGLAASNRAATSFDLNWTAATDNVAVAGYRVYVDDVLVASPTTTEATISGLTQATTYSVQVAAIDAAVPDANESPRATITVSTIDPTDVTPPTSPIPLGATNITNSSMRLTWSASTDDSGAIAAYEVHRLLQDGVSWSDIYLGPDTFFDITGLSPGTSYTFRIRAYDATGNAATSGTIVIATGAAADTTAPTRPGSPATASATLAGDVTLGWGASTDAVGVTGYRVSRLTGGGYILQGTTDATSIALAGQPIGTIATYAIAAVDDAGNISAALIVHVTIPAPPPPPPPPPAPEQPQPAMPASGLFATVTATRITLSWQQAGTTTTGWRVVEIRGGTVTSTREVASPTATFGPYAPNTSVRFELYSLAGGETSTAVTLDARTAADTAAPSRPGRVKATSPARGTLALAWTRSIDDVRLRGYEIRLTTRGAKPQVIKVGPTALRAKVVRLRARTPYVAQLRAVDVAGNASAWVTLRLRTR